MCRDGAAKLRRGAIDFLVLLWRKSFPHCLHAFQHELKALSAELGTVDHFFDGTEHLRIAGFFSQFFQKWMNLCKHDEHFSADGWLQEQIGIQRALQNE